MYEAAVAEVRAEKAAAAAEAAGVKQSGGGGGTPASARRRSRRQRQASSSTKVHVKPGEEPALNIPKPLLQPVLLGLDENEVDHICRMVLAFTLDPVVAGVKVRHFVGMQQFADALSSNEPRRCVEAIIAQTTSRDRGRFPLTQAAECLLELRQILVALQAATLVFDISPKFATAIADVFSDAVTCARAFYADLSTDVRARHEYMTRNLSDNTTEDELIAALKERYPHASSAALATGVYTPGRAQCRAEPFDKADKTSCGTCEKGYNSSEKYSDGALTLCCACAHPKILGFVVLDRKESPPVLINALLSRFPRLPRYLVYDFACGVVRCAMAKLPWMLRDLSVVF